MRSLRLVALVPSLAIIVFSSGQGRGAIHSVGSGRSIRDAASPIHSVTRSSDFKKQEPPKKFPLDFQTRSIPNLDSLIDQLVRHSSLDTNANKIMPWVYTTTTETVVADYEEALTRLEVADNCLQEAMRNVLFDRNSLAIDPLITQATSELDNAEFTILLLLEIAKLEL